MARRKVATIDERLEELRAARDEGKTELSVTLDAPELLDALFEIRTLKSLRLSHPMGQMTELPAALGNLTELTSLNLENNQLKTLPKEIGKLTKLETLYAYSNKMTSIPDEIGNLRKLKKLTLWSNELKGLPAGIGGLESLEELEVNWNKLKTLPPEIGKLSKLQELVLHDNEIASLPDLSGLVSLRKLDLKANKLKEIPESLFSLPKLELLGLKQNEIREIPPGISKMPALRELYLSGNAISALPEELFATKLVVLKLAGNKISKVPEGMARMKTLVTLDLVANPLQGIPEETLRSGKEAVFLHLGFSKPAVVEGDLPEESERKRIASARKEKLDKFARESRKKMYDRAMLEAILAFVTGQTSAVPPARFDDAYSFSTLPEALAPFPDWTFLDRRILRYLAQSAWFFRQPGHDYDTGFYEDFLRWLREQIEAEPADSTVFSAVAKLVVGYGIEEEALLAQSMRELGDLLVREGRPTSFGHWVLERASSRLDALGDVAARWWKPREGLVALLSANDRASFAKLAPKLLKIEPDDDGEVHVPHAELDIACGIDGAGFEALVLQGLEKTSCLSCKGECARLLTKHYAGKHRAKALEAAKAVLAGITERRNKESRYEFSWSGGGTWEDGTAEYVAWMLATFGKEVKDAVVEYAKRTKVYSLDVAEAVGKALGQDGVEIVAEGLGTSDGGAPFFRRLFGALAPLDWSAHLDDAWKVACSEDEGVREAACEAIAKLGPSKTLAKAKELLSAKKAGDRAAGIGVLSRLDTPEASRILEELRDRETSDDARDLILQAQLREEEKIDRKEVARRVAVAKERGRLDKPIAKWLDEKKLPPLSWAAGKKVDPETVRFLLYRQTRLADIAPEIEARDVYPLIDRESGGPFAKKLLELSLKNGGVSAKNRFALTLVGLFGGDDVVPPLEELSIEGRNENAVRILGMLGSMAAAAALDRVIRAFRTKYPNVREAAQDAFAAIAGKMRLTPFELADAMLPDFGFDGLALALPGKPKLEVVITPEIKAGLRDESGKLLKAPPKAITAKQKDALKALSKEIQEASKQLRGRLEQYLITRRRWANTAWTEFFLQRPLPFAFAQGLVWSGTEGGKTSVFRVTADGTLADREGKRAGLGSKATIALVHPLDLSDAERTAWQEAFASVEQQPFPQIARPVHLAPPADAEKRQSFRFEDRTLNALTFKGRAEKRGWRRGSVVDSGEVSSYRKSFSQEGVEVFVRLEGMNVQAYDVDAEVILQDFFFVKEGSVATGSYVYDEPRGEDDERLIPMAKVPPIVFSETIGDLEEITKARATED